MTCVSEPYTGASVTTGWTTYRSIHALCHMLSRKLWSSFMLLDGLSWTFESFSDLGMNQCSGSIIVSNLWRKVHWLHSSWRRSLGCHIFCNKPLDGRHIQYSGCMVKDSECTTIIEMSSSNWISEFGASLVRAIIRGVVLFEVADWLMSISSVCLRWSQFSQLSFI